MFVKLHKSVKNCAETVAVNDYQKFAQMRNTKKVSQFSVLLLKRLI
jgi:hypothetical protein